MSIFVIIFNAIFLRNVLLKNFSFTLNLVLKYYVIVKFS